MINDVNGPRSLTPTEIVFFFFAGLLLNAFGNGLTVSTNMGSAPWTAAAANLANVTHLSITVYLGLFGFIAAIVVSLITKRFDGRRFFGNLLFVAIYSFTLGYTNQVFINLGVGQLPIVPRFIIDILGLICIGAGVSITQRLQFVIHPVDDMTNVMRFTYFKGNVVVAQTLNFAIPMSMCLFIWLSTGQIIAVNIGTILAFLGMGFVIAIAERRVFARLVHRTM
ncbi:hypothetical protein OIT44_05430 [Weissella ceti]|uniref:Sugar specific permease n=1 Tax=Weissella ceti TaxID=759620 RepID=A0ABT3E4Z6_9LACO|nr:hypothetical protein [Weissella ceti]MCW0953511.1 hypothetical protein [Weissella ceti]QVK12098.1 hypothetical protein KHQ31_07805 [Weissella ceti]